jgi:hypothetical protein
MLEGIKRSRAARQFRRLVKPGFGEPISGDELAQLENSWVQMRVDPAALTPTTPAAAKYALGWGKKKTKQVTVFGRQEGAGVGYNPRYRGKRSYDPLLCLEANSALLSGQTSARAAPIAATAVGQDQQLGGPFGRSANQRRYVGQEQKR